MTERNGWKRLKRRFAVTLLVLGVLGLIVGLCLPVFSRSPAEADAIFKAEGVAATHYEYQRGTRAMHYVATGTSGLPLIVFVHGSPGSWDAFQGFLTDHELIEKAHLISVDRPGFGLSGPGKHEPSLSEQAADILPAIVEQAAGQPVILVGHSLGGPVIARVAMDYPGLVQGLVLVAPSIDPALEKTKWYQVPANWKVFSWLVPRALKMANREILPLKGELTQMLPLWQNLQQRVTVIQGDNDALVPPGNADFAQRVLTSAQLEMVRVPKQGHFIPWERPDLIKSAILTQLEVLGKPSQEPVPD